MMASEALRSATAGVSVDTRFDELEGHLRELRRSLGVHDDAGPAAGPASNGASTGAPEGRGEGRGPLRTMERPTSPPPFADRGAPARRGLGPDLVLIAAGWATLIVLVVRVLGQGS